MEAAAALPTWRANLATIAALMARAKNELLRVPGAAIPGVLAPTIFFLGLNGVFGALTHLSGFTTGSYESFIVPVSMLQGAGFTGAAAGSKPGARHRAGLARPAARLPRPALGAACRHGAGGEHPRADPGHLRARDRAGAGRRLPRHRRAA